MSNEENMGRWIKIAQKTSFPKTGGMCTEIEGKRIALFRVTGKFYAIDDLCRHRGGPLSEGVLDANVVSCPWHGFLFDVTTGSCATNPALKQTMYPVKTEGDDIYIEVATQT